MHRNAQRNAARAERSVTTAACEAAIASTTSSKSQASDASSLAQVLEQQVMLMQRLSESPNDISSGETLAEIARILEQH
ncbi:hypothetical protein DMN91_000331 [Ooceraea biroi]|uniref:Uncharacterized protein n=1 Tax=Ooceraea biroi TaxID=2015173 RepID=A0A3L8E2A6_OOCBI|nr:hypothetical protein DMN91_000331 [Ooceraea biroi]